MKLGKHQINSLAGMSATCAQVVGCAITRSLAKRGLMKALGKDGDSWYVITPEGLEALAASIRNGVCETNFTIPRMKAKQSIRKGRGK